MNYRAKLMSLIAVTVVATVGLVAWTASSMMRASFDRLDAQRTTALVAQFQREFAQRGVELTHQVEGIASAKDTQRIAFEITRSAPDYAAFVNEAGSLAAPYQLDFLEVLAEDGTIVSSAQWPARFGYKEPWITESPEKTTGGVFLKQEELPDGSALALMVVRPVHIGEKQIFLAGGRRLDSEFLASLTLSAGMRALLYRSGPNNGSGGVLTGAEGVIPHFEPLAPLISKLRANPVEQTQTVLWANNSDSAEIFHAFPLLGQHQEDLGTLLVGSSLREQISLQQRIRWLALVAGLAGIFLGMILSVWAASRVTKPIEQLARAAEEVALGRWSTRVPVTSNDEVGRLADAFNRMTGQLTEQREQLVQSERVAAWRELARRLAHELKNPLFPLQITVENLLRARGSNQFEEVFQESTHTLLAELGTLRTIIGRFSDFAKMPVPQLQPVDMNDVVKAAIRVFDAQFSAPDKPTITKQLEFNSMLEPIQVDPDLLQRAVQNLILNAIDAMPAGGTLTLRTSMVENGVKLEVGDTGTGLTREECERLFTPYYTTKQHGTGLGLAIVQSVVSDHHGRISVESEPGKGTTFRIILPRQLSMLSTNSLTETSALAGTRTLAI